MDKFIGATRQGSRSLQCSGHPGVHEYGGGSLCVVADAPYFVNEDGIFRQYKANKEPELVVAGDRFHRFADLHFHKGNLYTVYEVHSGKEVVNMVVRILEGAVQPQVTGADFYAFPRVSPDSRYFSWMEWNMPNMPWDETAVVVASMKKDGNVGEHLFRISREGVNFHCPEWTPLGDLCVVSDSTNWWNVYK
ncbi:unnamed protein product, partial [Gongylonema pulchrum]|uniref:DPPIV_N domain-containing protein n=1 Tax=Gongylonema pulchrum TaxID=637853 RepID=A0A183E0R3_9BILA